MAAGVAITWRRLLLTAVGTVGILLVFGLIDLARPPADRTHLGRLLSLVADQGPGGLERVIERKLSANVTILTSSVWALLIPASIAFLVFLMRARPPVLRQLEAKAYTVPELVRAVQQQLLPIIRDLWVLERAGLPLYDDVDDEGTRRWRLASRVRLIERFIDKRLEDKPTEERKASEVGDGR